jgi:methylglutamate dehydrogenase subunit C
MSRLNAGGLIDRSKLLSFRFDGRHYAGFAGDTLAAALVANDVQLVGRSFKYHRPRGIVTAGSEEPNALVTLGTGAASEPNTRATTCPLYEGLVARSQNRWPSLSFDAKAINQWLSPLLPAGFYYKTFMWPAAFWEKVYEPIIRRAAGLGALSGLPDPGNYDRTHSFCDSLVIGAGPAGLSAALVAARAGLRVVLVDEDTEPGGRLLAERHEIDGEEGVTWARRAAAELRALANVTVLSQTTVFGVYDGREYAAIEQLQDHGPAAIAGVPRQRFWKIVAKHALLASGAIERPLVFGGNDRPGVMMASAVSTYVNRFAAVPGRRAAIFTTTDSGWRTALDLVKSGVELVAVIDPRDTVQPAADRLRREGVECLPGSVVQDVLGTKTRCVSVHLPGGKRRQIAVDLLAMSGGWNPAIGLATHLGAKPTWSEAINSFLVTAPAAGLTPIGAAAGHFTLAEALREGGEAGRAVAAACGGSNMRVPTWRARDESSLATPLWRVAGSRKKAFIDFQHDVTDTDVELAAREGFVSVEHLKRYTTLGMATDQGKAGQLNGHALLAEATGRSIAATGTIASRPPYVPVSIAALAGYRQQSHFMPERLTASHAWAVEQAAEFVDAGLWKRARWFARPGENDWRTTVNREVTSVRNAVGICDVSTLGKIEVQGSDAGIFLDRLYVNNVSTLPVGKARYGLMLREDGIVLDDGTITRFAEHRYFLTTTTANAAKVMQHIEFARQVIWPQLDVQTTSTTEQWSTYAVAGPRSRALLQALLLDQDLCAKGFEFMAAREFRWRGKAARLFRVSFSGELAYEISIAASLGDTLIRALFEVGREYDVTPYGTEALSVMRIEKGHAAGPELNGQTTAGDLGLDRMMSTRKDFIGRVLARRPALTAPERASLVGLRPVRPRERVGGGAHLLPVGAPAVAQHDQGHVTSATYSPTCDHWIALALLERGPERLGERLRAYDPMRNSDVEVEVCKPVFVDPDGVRVRG